MSRIRADDVVRYATLLSELMSGSVDVQSKARRSYRAGVMPTEALLALGMLKLLSRMVRGFACKHWTCLRYQQHMQRAVESEAADSS